MHELDLAARRGRLAREARGGGLRPRAIRRRSCSIRDSAGLQLLQRIRDEAHRFALGFHRTRREARAKESILDALPGVGPARKRALIAPLRLTRAAARGDAGRARGRPGRAGEGGQADLRRPAQGRPGVTPPLFVGAEERVAVVRRRHEGLLDRSRVRPSGSGSTSSPPCRSCPRPASRRRAAGRPPRPSACRSGRSFRPRSASARRLREGVAILREDGARQRVGRGSVDELERVLEVALGIHVAGEDRAEQLVTEQAETRVARLDDRRLDEVADRVVDDPARPRSRYRGSRGPRRSPRAGCAASSRR